MLMFNGYRHTGNAIPMPIPIQGWNSYFPRIICKLSKEGPTCHMILFLFYFPLNQFRETLTLSPTHLIRISIDQCWALKWPLAKKLKYGLFFNFPTHIPITPPKTRRRTRRTLLRSVWSERTTAINDEDISIFVTGQAVISLKTNGLIRY